MGLGGLAFEGYQVYTWTNNQSNRVYSWLDRFLFSADWLEHELVSQETLPCSGSDHVLVLLNVNTIDAGPCPSKFKLMWLDMLSFKDQIRDWWMGFEVEGSASFRFAQN